MGAILVTGGAGYIGSHTLLELGRIGLPAVCLDNLSTGFRSFVGDVPLVVGDLSDPEAIDRAFATLPVDAVIHFASHAQVEESCRNPFRYFRDNLMNCLNLLEGMRRHGVGRIVFSSSCAAYGIPRDIPIRETAALNPINPYGATKMMIERILLDYHRSHGIRSVSLRYFNAAGAAPSAGIGEMHSPETHLIPRLLDVARGRGAVAEIYGTDYPTPDGTCIRDYIHVTDLATAHLAALGRLEVGNGCEVYNLGTGTGSSVKQVIDQVAATTGIELPLHCLPRRPGDPAALVADPAKVRSCLGWVPEHSSLKEIVETAWAWHQTLRSLPST